MKNTKPLLLVLSIIGMFAPNANAFVGGLGAFNNEKLSKDPTNSAIWRATLDFANPEISRVQLLAEFEAFATNYPGSQYEQRATDTVGILKRMVAEDAAHAKVDSTNLDLLPVDDRVRELIFQLRDQHGQQWSQPGWCDIFNDERGTNSPAAQLVNIGYPAVPQLIAVLEDPTFTRSVGYGRNFFFSHTVLSVGDCAAAILQRIAGRSFYRPASTSGYMSNENKNSATRLAVEAWWAEFQKKGEEQMLIEGTEAGNSDSPALAEMLVERYPKLALAPLIKGTKTSSDEWVKARLVQLFDKYDSPEVLEFLDQVMRAGLDSASVGAASILNRKGKSGVIPVMMQKWQQSPNADDNGALVGFLANADSPEAIAALDGYLGFCSLNKRMGVVCCVGESGTWAGGSPTNRSIATLGAMERFLIKALQDDGQKMGESASRMGKNYINPRVCDMAGFFLNQRWPDRYNFDLEASLKVRDTQRVECQNIWRRSQNLSLLPLPAPSTNHVSASEAAKVAVIAWKADTAKPSDGFAARVEAFNGKPLSAEQVVNLLANYASSPEIGTSGLVFEARKDEDLTGVKLSFGLIPGTAQNPKDDWQFAEGAVLGNKAIDCRAGGIWATKKRSWEDLARIINTAISAPPETPFVINVKLFSKER